jgi:hypothetical protein
MLSKVSLAFGLAVAASSASAGVVVQSGGSAGFQAAGSLGQSGPAYWANGSFDGGQANIGYFLNKSGYFGASFGGHSPGIAVGDMEYWGQASGAADANMTFSATGRVQVELLLTLAGDFAVNEFGWYKAGDAGSTVKLFENGFDSGSGTQTLVFGNAAGYGVSPLAATFNPRGDFGFYIRNGLGETFYTESSLNTAGAVQEFAVFRSLLEAKDGVLYLGGEDRTNGDFDMNDYVIRMSSVVPEPASVVLMAIAVAVVGLGRLRRRTNS